MVERLPLILSGAGRIPMAKLSKNFIDLGDVKQNEEIEFTLFIENDGEIDCPWKLNLYSSPFGSKFRFSKISGVLRVDGNKRDTIKVIFCSSIVGRFEETFRVTLVGTEKRLRLVLKGNVQQDAQGRAELQLWQPEQSSRSKATYMSNDREDDSSLTSGDDDEQSNFYQVEDINNSLLHRRSTQRRLGQGGVARQNYKSNIRIEPPPGSGISHGQRSTSIGRSEQDVELQREIDNLLVDAEQNTEKESEAFLRMTTRGSKQFNQDYRHRVNSDELSQLKDQRATVGAQPNAESEEDEEPYQWSEDSLEQKENIAGNKVEERASQVDEQRVIYSNHSSSFKSFRSDSQIKATAGVTKFRDQDRPANPGIKVAPLAVPCLQRNHDLYYRKNTGNISIIKEESSPHKLASPLESRADGKRRTRRSTFTRGQTKASRDSEAADRFQIRPVYGFQRQKTSDEANNLGERSKGSVQEAMNCSEPRGARG